MKPFKLLLTLFFVLAIATGCKTNTLTGKKTLNFFGDNKPLFAMSLKQYETFLSEHEVVRGTEDAKLVSSIGKDIAKAAQTYFNYKGQPNLLDEYDWEYRLVKSDQVNAWCMPGGKIAVYTGILKVTKNTDGLASVMGHEIAHAVAKHSVERASRSVLLNTSTQLIDIFSGGKLSQVNRVTGMNTVGLLSQIGLMNPFSRTQESEADYLGMIFASLSGFDIRETKKLWERMKESNKGKEPPQFMSTHPSSSKRIKDLSEWENSVILDYPPINIS